MADGQVSNNLPGNPVKYPYATSPIAGAEMAAGTVVYLNSSGRAVPAQANASATAVVIGVTLLPSIIGNPVPVAWGGSLELPPSNTALPLTPGQQMFLSPGTAGALTSVAPSGGGQFVVAVGIAETTTSLFVQVGPQQAAGSP
jgi:hypothetical protein